MKAANKRPAEDMGEDEQPPRKILKRTVSETSCLNRMVDGFTSKNPPQMYVVQTGCSDSFLEKITLISVISWSLYKSCSSLMKSCLAFSKNSRVQLSRDVDLFASMLPPPNYFGFTFLTICEKILAESWK